MLQNRGFNLFWTKNLKNAKIFAKSQNYPGTPIHPKDAVSDLKKVAKVATSIQLYSHKTVLEH